MHIPDKNFRMKPAFSAMLVSMKGSKEHKSAWKRMFIQAQLSEETAHRNALKSKDTGTRGQSRGAVAPD